MGFFEKIRKGLEKTRETGNLTRIFSGFSKIGDDFYDELEEALIVADIGLETAGELTEELRLAIKREGVKDMDGAKAAFRQLLVKRLDGGAPWEPGEKGSLCVVLVVGVNGVGKTTTIGKLACLLAAQGKKVLLCAGDTFRAAAAEQLSIWAERAGAELVRQHEGADAGAVVYDAITAAKARGTDVVLVDTAGRLHNKANLMQELTKISRVIDRELPDARRETFLVLDATTGQNGLLQARAFAESVPVTGLVLSKLDGTAKGGIVVAITRTLGAPIRFVGVGEQRDDLIPFDAAAFAEGIF